MIPREPSYQGKPLSFWLTTAIEHGGAFSDPKDPKAIECREAVCSIGTNAIPVLLRILRAKDTVLKKVVMDLLDKQNYINIPIESVEEQIPKAGVGFHLLGELATNALPALVDVCQHPPSPSAKDVAETVLLQLYPAKSVAIPYWVPAEKRARWYIAAGRDQAQSGTQSNALLAFSQAIELEPTNVYAYLDRGDTRLQLQDLTGARMDFEKVMELSPSNGAAIFGRGLCRFGLKDFKGAETDFTKAINVDSNEFALRVFNARGLARANLRNLDDALSDFNKAIEINPYGASFYRDRAAVETGQTEYERALADASKSVELDKEDAMAWALRGRIQCALKNYRDAVEDADKAIQLSPKESIAYTGRATARMCMNEFDSSAADLEKALQLNPKNPSAFVIRGVLRAKHGGQDDAALADLEHAVELAPTEPGPYGTLGLFQYKVSKWEPALANCRKALEMGAIASVSSYHSYIWLIRAQSGEEEAANKELEAYLNSLDRTKTNEWSATTARFFSGSLPESNFLSLATTAAKRPSAITNQISDSLFYAAMKRKLAGDKVGAVELLQKCLDTRDENNIAYMNAGVELRALKAQ